MLGHRALATGALVAIPGVVADIIGTLAATESGDVLVAAGDFAIQATLNVTEDDDTTVQFVLVFAADLTVADPATITVQTAAPILTVRASQDLTINTATPELTVH